MTLVSSHRQQPRAPDRMSPLTCALPRPPSRSPSQQLRLRSRPTTCWQYSARSINSANTGLNPRRAGQAAADDLSSSLIFAPTTTFSWDTPSKWSCRRRSASSPRRRSSACEEIVAVTAGSELDMVAARRRNRALYIGSVGSGCGLARGTSARRSAGTGDREPFWHLDPATERDL